MAKRCLATGRWINWEESDKAIPFSFISNLAVQTFSRIGRLCSFAWRKGNLHVSIIYIFSSLNIPPFRWLLGPDKHTYCSGPKKRRMANGKPGVVRYNLQTDRRYGKIGSSGRF